MGAFSITAPAINLVSFFYHCHRIEIFPPGHKHHLWKSPALQMNCATTTELVPFHRLVETLLISTNLGLVHGGLIRKEIASLLNWCIFLHGNFSIFQMVLNQWIVTWVWSTCYRMYSNPSVFTLVVRSLVRHSAGKCFCECDAGFEMCFLSSLTFCHLLI